MMAESTPTIPVKSDLDENLDKEAILAILSQVRANKDLLSTAPPVLPKGGELYVYDLGSSTDKTVMERNKKRFRCDQYRWVTKGVYTIKSEHHILKKRSNAVDCGSLPAGQGNMEFRRWEYWGFHSLFALHYTGDHTCFKSFPHRGLSSGKATADGVVEPKPFIRSAPFVKEKVVKSNLLKPVKQIYRDIVNKEEGGARHAIQSPRNAQQVKNFRDAFNREQRLSHDALYNLYQLCFQLKFPNRNGDAKEFIARIQLHPSIIVQLMPIPLLESLQQLLNVQSIPTLLHYDTVFNMGDYYLSTLTFRHSFFAGDPIIPCGFLIHSRRYHRDHKEFMIALTEVVKPLLTKQVNIVTDREFKFNDLFPVGMQLYCWNHFETDVHWYLKNKANCTPEDVNLLVNAFRSMITCSTEAGFEQEWSDLRESSVMSRNSKVCNYFESNVLPSFKAHSAIWRLKEAGVANPHNGVTNNASESMNAVLRRLQQWKQVPLDMIVISLYQLSVYYRRELERSMHQCGQWSVKREFDYLKREPSLMPRMDIAPDPNEIVEMVRQGDFPLAGNGNTSEDDETGFAHKSTTTSVSPDVTLAQCAIANSRVKLVEDGAWVVLENDRVSASAVKLFPKETCSCPSTKTCYHIIACRLMVGLPPTTGGKANVTQLRRNERKKRERPSGRKQPRKYDFTKAKDDDADYEGKKRPMSVTCTVQSRSKKPKVLDEQAGCVPSPSAGNNKSARLPVTVKKRDDHDGDDDEDIHFEDPDFISPHSPAQSVSATTVHPLDKPSSTESALHDQLGDHSTIKGKEKFNVSTSTINESEQADFRPHQNNKNVPECDRMGCLIAKQNTNLSIIANTKSFNTPCTRRLHCQVSWEEFLSYLCEKHPESILVPYVCQVDFNNEIAHLKTGQFVVVETTKSKQVALLRIPDLTDEDIDVPVVEVFSTYKNPDNAELNYHAGVMLRHDLLLDTFVAHYVGAQFIDDASDTDGSYHDVLLAGLLVQMVQMCSPHSRDISLIQLDVGDVCARISNFLNSSIDTLPYTTTSHPYCEAVNYRVHVHCFCRTPWIDGTTSNAIYGENQSQFDMHKCCMCNRWFHYYCLSKIGISLPKKRQDFFCPDCKLPHTIPWAHHKYHNTCTSDNIMTIILLHCHQNPNFLEVLDTTHPAESSLKSAILMMMEGRVSEGKGLMLDYAQTICPYRPIEENHLYDCYGSEYGMFLTLFKHTWKLSLSAKCDSQFCPSSAAVIERYPMSFNFQPLRLSSESFTEQVASQFPKSGNSSGYCGKEFESTPPSTAPHALNHRMDVTTSKESSFLECRGSLVVCNSSFLCKKPWMIPFCISSFAQDHDDVFETLDLPGFLDIYGNRYHLAGFTLLSHGHYTAVTSWRGALYHYDGMQEYRNRLVQLQPAQHLKDREGSYAIYLQE